MDFSQASEALKRCPTDEDIAQEVGVGVQSIRQARLDPSHPGSRPPPEGWPAAIARLARRRARELEELAGELGD